MENMNDRWDLSYLYPGFDDEQFKADLASLKGEAEKGIALLKDASLSRLEILEQSVIHSEEVSAKVDRLANFVYCTSSVDATNEKADAAMDQLSVAFTDLELAEVILQIRADEEDPE